MDLSSITSNLNPESSPESDPNPLPADLPSSGAAGQGEPPCTLGRQFRRLDSGRPSQLGRRGPAGARTRLGTFENRVGSGLGRGWGGGRVSEWWGGGIGERSSGFSVSNRGRSEDIGLVGCCDVGGGGDGARGRGGEVAEGVDAGARGGVGEGGWG